MYNFFTVLFILITTMQILPADEVSYCDTECNSHAYRYQTFGTGPFIFIPNVGVGYRSYSGNHGWDAALNLGTIGYGNQLQGSLLYHFVPNPQSRQHWYWGLGAGTSALFGFGDFKGITGIYSGMLSVGKEFCGEDGHTHFIETKISIPTWSYERIGGHKPIYLPLMIIQYGSSF